MLHLVKMLKAKPAPHEEAQLAALPTPWGEQLDTDHVLEEHPQPQFARQSWRPLNGVWTCAFVASGHAPADDLEAVCAAAEQPDSDAFAQQIVVPFSPEAPLSSVGRQLKPDELLWYRRCFDAPDLADGERLLLHFEAVDTACAVRVNDTLVGTHTGGYLPFCLDITDALRAGANELAVCVADPSEQGGQLRGKQRLDRGDIWYTAQSGIWQSVWLEAVPASHIERVRIEPDVQTGAVRASLKLASASVAGPSVRLEVLDAGQVVAAGECEAAERCTVEAVVPDVVLWSPDNPHLYQLRFVYGDDAVESYCGFRTVEVRRDAAGRPRVFLNGEPFFVRAVLDQGYWSDGLLTAPSDEALIFDIQAMRAAGFNTLRKHVKVESARWYFHCDRLGMLVWQDMVSGGAPELFSWNFSYKPTLLRASWSRYRDDVPAHQAKLGAGNAAYRATWERDCLGTIAELANHPSIIIWTLFNEGWGQFDSKRMFALARETDSSRPFVATSGWYDQGAGDIRGVHNYFRDMAVWPDRKLGRAFMVSEFGGYAHHVDGHSAVPETYGYEVYGEMGEWRRAVRGLLAQMDALEAQGLAGYVYTQVSDVEEEVNGILTYDRRINKFE